jgi:hypothetical protein
VQKSQSILRPTLRDLSLMFILSHPRPLVRFLELVYPVLY